MANDYPLASLGRAQSMTPARSHFSLLRQNAIATLRIARRMSARAGLWLRVVAEYEELARKYDEAGLNKRTVSSESALTSEWNLKFRGRSGLDTRLL